MRERWTGHIGAAYIGAGTAQLLWPNQDPGLVLIVTGALFSCAGLFMALCDKK